MAYKVNIWRKEILVFTINVRLSDRDQSEICNAVLFQCHVVLTSYRDDFTFKCDASYLLSDGQWPSLTFTSRYPDSLRLIHDDATCPLFNVDCT